MELSQPLLEEAGSRSDTLRPRTLVGLAERYGAGAAPEPGVPRSWVLAHAEALAEEGHVEEESFRDVLASVTTDSETWVDDRAVYEVGEDRLSAYPPAWHEAIDEGTSLPDIVRFLIDESDYRPVNAGAGDGVLDEDLFDVASTLGGFTRESARAALQDCRDDGRLVEDVDQHPRSMVYLPRSDREADVEPR